MGARLEGNARRGEFKPTAEDIKAEAARRIIEIMPEHEQRNTLAAGLAATTQFGPNPANWPTEARERYAAAMAKWDRIEQIRERSNHLEGLADLPLPLRDDVLWQ